MKTKLKRIVTACILIHWLIIISSYIVYLQGDWDSYFKSDLMYYLIPLYFITATITFSALCLRIIPNIITSWYIGKGW